MFSARTLVIKAKPHQYSKLLRPFCTSNRLHNYDRAIDHFPCPPGRSKALNIVQARAQDVESAVHGKVNATVDLREQEVTRPEAQPDLDMGPTRAGHSHATISYTVPTEGSLNIEDTIVAPGVQTDRTRAHGTKAIKSMMSAQPASLPDTQNLDSDLLSRDPRWSTLPAQAHSATMAALTSLIVPGVPSSPNAVNTFKSLDAQPPLEPSKSCTKRQAIVLDCEMVGVGPGGSISALGRLSAIDFLTGELLIDKLVQPPRIVTKWRTQWSGITAASMQAARDSGEVLEGAAAARELISRHMDDETVLVGHALYNDLAVLGIQHEKVVDSASMVEAAVGYGVRIMLGLKKLCKELLGISVQEDGRKGHDSIEDVLATRELVLWCMEHPKVLRGWGAKRKNELEAKELELKAKHELQAKRKKELKAKEVEARELEAKVLSATRKIKLGVARMTELAAKIDVLGAKELKAATQEMQHAARKVAQENERLQTLFARRRVLEAELDSSLRMCEQTEASSARPEVTPTSMSKQEAGQADMIGADLQCVQDSKPLLIRRLPGSTGTRLVRGRRVIDTV